MLWFPLKPKIAVSTVFRRAYYEGVGLSPVIEPRLIARRYIFGHENRRGLGWFWPDVAAAIPFDLVPASSNEAMQALSLAKLGRLFRLGASA